MKFLKITFIQRPLGSDFGNVQFSLNTILLSNLTSLYYALLGQQRKPRLTARVGFFETHLFAQKSPDNPYTALCLGPPLAAPLGSLLHSCNISSFP